MRQKAARQQPLCNSPWFVVLGFRRQSFAYQGWLVANGVDRMTLQSHSLKVTLTRQSDGGVRVHHHHHHARDYPRHDTLPKKNPPCCSCRRRRRCCCFCCRWISLNKVLLVSRPHSRRPESHEHLATLQLCWTATQ